MTAMRLEGVPKTLRVLDALPHKIRKRSVSKAIRAGGGPFVKAAKRNAPRRAGIFKRSLTQKVKSYRGGATTLTVIGQMKGGKIQAKKAKRGGGGISGRGGVVPIHLVEEDIKPHTIAGPSQLSGGEWAEGIDHPGTRGQHPIRKAAQQAEGQAVRKFEDKLRTEVDKEAATAAVF